MNNGLVSSTRLFGVCMTATVALAGIAPGPAARTRSHITVSSNPSYQRFCTANSDLCTVTVRAKRHGQERAFRCTLNAGPTRCPSDAVLTGGPYDPLRR
jgi:hypothetical protein